MWWRHSDNLQRFVGDLLAGELAAIRPAHVVPALPWAPAMRLDDEGIGADSLDRLKLATSLGEAIHLDESGVEDSLLSDATIGAWVATAARSLERFSTELTFKTSGSTGQPKWCVHELVDLSAEIDLITRRFGGCRRLLSAVPSHHIYGFLFTLLLPARSGIADVVDVRGRTPATVAGLARDGDLIVGHPAFWTAFIRGSSAVAAGVRAVTSTAPCPPEVVRAVTATGISALVEVYGSSETAGMGLRDDPAKAYELFPYWRRGSTPSELVRVLPDGSERSVDAPDRLEWDDPRHFRPAGRREGAVQVGGHNVSPEHVRDVLREHPAVADATVRLMRPDEGDRLKAFVVPRPSAPQPAALRAELARWIDARLTVAERPRAIAFGPELPTNALGKHTDWFAGADDTP